MIQAFRIKLTKCFYLHIGPCKQSDMTHSQILPFERHLDSAALLSISVHGRVLRP